jgi:hypothetical protein
MPRPREAPVFFIDHCLGTEKVAQRLRQAGVDARVLAAEELEVLATLVDPRQARDLRRHLDRPPARSFESVTPRPEVRWGAKCFSQGGGALASSPFVIYTYAVKLNNVPGYSELFIWRSHSDEARRNREV